MQKRLLILAFGIMLISVKGSVNAYFNYGVFNIPSNSPFLETYITIIGKSIKHKPVAGGFQGSINIKVNIYLNDKLFKTNNYNLLSPVDKDTLSFSTFIDNQRYALPNGNYLLEMILRDNNETFKPPFAHEEKIVINFDNKELTASSIEPLDSYSKTNIPGPISKSGFDLVPYNVNYYPQHLNKLVFYMETYNTDTVLGSHKSFIYTYFVEKKEDQYKPEGMGGFKKQATAKVNPLLAQIDISKLESGNYNLVIQVRDQNNVVRLEKKWFFQRQSNFVRAATFKENRSTYEFFGNYSNADTLKMFVECLWPISTTLEREWEINQSVKKSPDLMKKFIVNFWEKRAGDSLNPLSEWMKYYARVVEVNKLFKCGRQKGYYTDRGRAFLQYGKPNTRNQQPNDSYSYPYEIWQYYRIQDAATGQFYTNKKFVFVNKGIADDCYKLIHSDMRGEIYNDNWQYEISKQQNTDPNNPNNTAPSSTYGSNADDYFNNPR